MKFLWGPYVFAIRFHTFLPGPIVCLSRPWTNSIFLRAKTSINYKLYFQFSDFLYVSKLRDSSRILGSKILPINMKSVLQTHKNG